MLPDTPTSRIGLGLAALGRPGYINVGHGEDLAGALDVAALEARCHAVLDAAFASGVRFFDAARGYGRAEEFLASWLKSRAIAPGTLTIASKWGYTYAAGWQVQAEKHEVKDHSLPTLRRQWAETRALLGDHLQLYQVHSATLESGILDDRAVLDELRRLRDGGLRVGLTLSGARQAETLRRAIPLGVFDTVQATWNLFERSCEPALIEAHEAGLGVIVKEALANGRLTARSREPALAPLAEAARALEAGEDAVAIAAVLARPWADVVLSGATTLEQLASNLRADELVFERDLEAALAGLEQPAADYWQVRSRLAWN
jgi:aryl-alcohol dehydrogenase-like predicted oxidoreductase